MINLSNCNEVEQFLRARKVKYEITGNYTGKFFVAYTDNTGGYMSFSQQGVPWSLELMYSELVDTIGILVQASVIGSAGERATLKIFVDGEEVKSTTATARSHGDLVLPSLGLSLQ